MMWAELWPMIEPLIREHQPSDSRWPRQEENDWIGPLHSPLRDDRNPSFSVRPDSTTDPGAWKDHATGEHGSMADLATRLGIDPRQTVAKEIQGEPELTLAEFCKRRKLDFDLLTKRWRVFEAEFHRRPALAFPTSVGFLRVKYLDGKKPKAGWLRRGGKSHWYGLSAANQVGGDVLYIVNGEPSVWACAQAEVPAVCTCSGEHAAPNEEMVSALEGSSFSQFRVVFDRDESGRQGALKLVNRLSEAGLDSKALDLPAKLGPGSDVDDLHRLAGDNDLGRELAALPAIQKVATSPNPADLLAAAKTLDEVDGALRLLETAGANLGPIDLALLRERAIEALNTAPVSIGAPARLVDSALRRVAANRPDDDCRKFILSDPEPWGEDVDGIGLLDDLTATFLRYLIMQKHEAVAAALWVIHAHGHNASDISPLFAFTSPEKRCGKTLALEITSALVPRPLPASNVTAAALFRTVERHTPTVLVDEADTFLRDNDELRGVLNSGHRRTTAMVIRCVGDAHEPSPFSTWCPKVIALIGNLSATLEDRSIVIRMRRKAGSESVDRWRSAYQQNLEPLRRQAARWVADHASELAETNPDVPETLNDRAADNWRPILAIADAAGGDWPQRARHAALALEDGEPDSESRGVLLLTDMCALFQKHGGEMTSAKVVETLTEMEERPWSEVRRGSPITKAHLAKLLRPFGIRPTQYRDVHGEKVRGYVLKDCLDAFSRYVPSELVQSVQASYSNSYVVPEPVQRQLPVPGDEGIKSNEMNDVPDVPVQPAAGGTVPTDAGGDDGSECGGDADQEVVDDAISF